MTRCRTLLAVLVLVLTCLWCAGRSCHAQTVRFRLDDGSQAHGFVVMDRPSYTLVMTCLHVVQTDDKRDVGGEEPRDVGGAVITPDNQLVRFDPEQIVWRHVRTDLALVGIPQRLGTGEYRVPSRGRGISGDVYVDFPDGRERQYSDTWLEPNKWGGLSLMTTLSIQRGDSGLPLFAHGDVIAGAVSYCSPVWDLQTGQRYDDLFAGCADVMPALHVIAQYKRKHPIRDDGGG